jgi:hypothetical protein
MPQRRFVVLKTVGIWPYMLKGKYAFDSFHVTSIPRHKSGSSLATRVCQENVEGEATTHSCQLYSLTLAHCRQGESKGVPSSRTRGEHAVAPDKRPQHIIVELLTPFGVCDTRAEFGGDNTAQEEARCSPIRELDQPSQRVRVVARIYIAVRIQNKPLHSVPPVQLKSAQGLIAAGKFMPEGDQIQGDLDGFAFGFDSQELLRLLESFGIEPKLLSNLAVPTRLLPGAGTFRRHCSQPSV